MNTYEAKKLARIERLRARAAKQYAIAEANSMANICGEYNTGIPLGQPIFVGHHSERRHRKAIESIDKKLKKGFEAAKYARELEARAEAAESRKAIDSDNPEAMRLLTEKLQKYEGMKGIDASAERARLRKRIAAQKIIDQGFEPFEINGVKVALFEGQIQVDFPSKPSEEIRGMLKRSPLALKWSSYSKKWVRKHTASTASRYFQDELKRVLGLYEPQ
jgi:hypothetical protein